MVHYVTRIVKVGGLYNWARHMLTGERCRLFVTKTGHVITLKIMLYGINA